jgi:hypothetical protein
VFKALMLSTKGSLKSFALLASSITGITCSWLGSPPISTDRHSTSNVFECNTQPLWVISFRECLFEINKIMYSPVYPRFSHVNFVLAAFSMRI